MEDLKILSANNLYLLRERYGWNEETAESNVEKTREMLGLTIKEAMVFLLHGPIPGLAMIVCDACNVRPPFEHRCHGSKVVVEGKPLNKPCGCLDCFVAKNLRLG